MRTSPAQVLVVEDDLLIAMEVAHLVRQCGCAVVGPVGRLEKALRVAEQTELDGAVLDIHLGSRRVWPLAELLAERAVPFVLLSGYTRGDVPARFGEVPLVSKPVTLPVLRNTLNEIGLIRG